jgi:hypothetical protein
MSREPINWGPFVVMVLIAAGTVGVAYIIAHVIARMITGAVGL